MTLFQSTPERLEQTAKLRAYLEAVADGDERSWDRIAADTGIAMDESGRGLARRALGKRPYESIRGHGVRMSSAETALTIAHGKVVRIDSSVRRADKTQQELQRRHLQQMSGPAQQRMLVLTSFFATVRALAMGTRSKALRG